MCASQPSQCCIEVKRKGINQSRALAGRGPGSCCFRSLTADVVESEGAEGILTRSKRKQSTVFSEPSAFNP